MAKWTLTLFYSFFSVPKPIAYVRHPNACVTVAIMLTRRKLCGFRGRGILRNFHSGIFGFDDFEKKNTQNTTIFLTKSLQTVARRIKMKTLNGIQ